MRCEVGLKRYIRGKMRRKRSRRGERVPESQQAERTNVEEEVSSRECRSERCVESVGSRGRT